MKEDRQFIDVKQRQITIELPEAFVNQRVEVIARTMGNEVIDIPKQRSPHPTIAGKGRTLGDLVGPIVEGSDWECLK